MDYKNIALGIYVCNLCVGYQIMIKHLMHCNGIATSPHDVMMLLVYGMLSYSMACVIC
jgi:hypothetical protein